MKKVLVIAGPTGVGKTEFSIEVAKQYNGEIISGDSIQVFQGMDIGTGKITEEEMSGVIHHGLDILSPKEKYNVADFQKLARDKIDEISAKGRLPIIVGGTGLYIKACLYDYEFAKQEENSDVIAYFETLTNEELIQYLEKNDKEQAQKIHGNNRKRLVRACVMHQTHQISKSDQIAKQKHIPIYNALILGCTMEREALYHQINQRVEKMVQLGLKEEIKKLLDQGVQFSDHAMQGIGYREWQGYFSKEQTEAEVVASIQQHSRQFARRQYTWFKNQMPVTWVEVKKEKESIMKTIGSWVSE
ncbi:MAG: tRNA (adenosine(37)-N6)-dimethylallyltransferase MiaA [Anaerorhabdus sp.]